MNKIENVIKLDRIDNSIKDDAILYKDEIFTYFDSGLTRHVFVNADKTKVIKLLINKDGSDFNSDEINIYNNASKKNKAEMAKTELTYGGLIIEQEYCNPIKLDKRKLTIGQMLFATSCRNEVGWTAEGKLVCFDLDEYKRY